ncbi:MAG TPA: hypothetical protein VFF69_11595 [Phycisphaerales bacterium]|nr:hypothetical protein [Phycisphaerales bacterium]
MRVSALAIVVVGGLAAAASADVVSIDARAAIFDAGRSAPTLGGLLPPMLEIPAGAEYVTFSDVSGLVRAHPVLQWAGPDGNSATLNDTDINSYLGISGLVHPRTLPLVAVFLGEAEPENPAPARMDFYAIGSEFTELTPLVQQTYFVGDGQAVGGEGSLLQKFYVPEGATRLYLGLADAGYFTGDVDAQDPTAYPDNEGSFNANVQFHVIPTPGSLALLTMGGAMTFRRRR